MQQHGSNILTADPEGQKVKIQLFSEHGHVAYQIKGNHECSNIVANILPADQSPIPHQYTFHATLGFKFKIQLFQNIVMWHIKLKGMANAATW